MYCGRYCSVTKGCLNLHNPPDCSTSGIPFLSFSLNLPKSTSIELVMPSKHLILCLPLLLLLSIFPSNRGFLSKTFSQLLLGLFIVQQQLINMSENFQMFKLDLELAEEPKIKLPISAGSQKKQDSSRKTSTSAFLTTSKPLTVQSTTNCGKLLKRQEHQTT